MHCFDIKNKNIFPEKQYIGIKGSCININTSEQKPAPTKTAPHWNYQTWRKPPGKQYQSKAWKPAILAIHNLANSPCLLSPQRQAQLICLSFSICRIPCISVIKYLWGSLLLLFFITDGLHLIFYQGSNQVATPAQGCSLSRGLGSQPQPSVHTEVDWGYLKYGKTQL